MQIPGCLALLLPPSPWEAREDCGVPSALPHHHHKALPDHSPKGAGGGQTVVTEIRFPSDDSRCLHNMAPATFPSSSCTT